MPVTNATRFAHLNRLGKEAKTPLVLSCTKGKWTASGGGLAAEYKGASLEKISDATMTANPPKAQAAGKTPAAKANAKAKPRTTRASPAKTVPAGR